MRSPMLALPGGLQDLERPGFIYEPKLDGTRALCYKGARLTFVNRRGRDISERYPEFDFYGDIKAATCILDGEVVVFDSRGNPDFRLLQKREHSSVSLRHLLSAKHPATYIVFDILEKDGKDLASLALLERRKILLATVTESRALRVIVHTNEGRKMWELVKQRGIEGVMAKREDSTYEEGRRSDAWIKIKTTNTLDCVIIGYTSEQRALSALALGLFDGNMIIYVGKVGTGFTDAFLEELKRELDKNVVVEPVVVNPPEQPMTWTLPELVCEVEYLEVTSSLHLRAPSFKRMRPDKLPDECTLDQIRE